MMKNLLKLTAISCVALSLALTGCKKENAEMPVANKTIDLKNMDTVNYKPGDDFYRYVNGNWLKNNPCPPSESRWSAFNVLDEENRTRISDLFKEIAAKDAKKGTDAQKIRDFYNTGMDSVKIDKLGAKPLLADLKVIDDLKTADDLQKYLAEKRAAGFQYIFGLYAGADEKNSSMVITNIYQSGLALPERDYYLLADDYSKNIRAKYLEHITKMFVLTGLDKEVAKTNAETVLKIETRLAKASMSIEERRNPNKTYNKFNEAEIAKLTPNINWEYLWTAMKVHPGELVCGQPLFFKEVNKMMKDVKIEDWKVYLKWHLTTDMATQLSSDFVKENFDFYSRTLSGQKEMRPRWKDIQDVVDGALSEAVGKLYVEKYFPPKAKERMDKLVNNIKTALGEHIEKVAWMDPATKVKATEKLKGITYKIGYPSKWRDYSKLQISDKSYYENYKSYVKFETEWNFSKINKPVDKTEWGMSPQTVNAYFDPSQNEIVFPAAILQPPFFDMDADDAINYGAIGVVIGHELTHGFDDQGRLYDKNGNLAEWWLPTDSKNFMAQAQTLVDQFASYKMLDSVKLNGVITLGENIADYGGLSVSMTAFKKAMNGKVDAPKIDGFTPLQRFFISYAQVWRNNITDEALRRRIKEDVHSPGEYRVNGGIVNIPEFYQAFNVKPGDKLYLAPEKRAKIW
jgi:putative endopeptidase